MIDDEIEYWKQKTEVYEKLPLESMIASKIKVGDTVAYRWTNDKVYSGKIIYIVKDFCHVYDSERHRPNHCDLVRMDMITSVNDKETE